MSLPVKSLKAVGGEMYAHLFENKNAGIARNLYWSVSLDFAPIEYGESNFHCAMTCEWIPWTVRDWRDLDGAILEVQYNADGTVMHGLPGVEASFYMTAHDPAQQVRLQLQRHGATGFTAAMQMIVDFQGYYGGDGDPNLLVAGEATIDYRGIIIVKGNPFPKPTTLAELRKVAEEFIDWDVYGEPIDEDWRWIIPPKA